MTEPPQFLNLEEARELLASCNIVLNARQMQRAAEPNAAGQRKLPFFRDPIDGRLRIEKNALLRVYHLRTKAAENSAISPDVN